MSALPSSGPATLPISLMTVKQVGERGLHTGHRRDLGEGVGEGREEPEGARSPAGLGQDVAQDRADVADDVEQRAEQGDRAVRWLLHPAGRERGGQLGGNLVDGGAGRAGQPGEGRRGSGGHLAQGGDDVRGDPRQVAQPRVGARQGRAEGAAGRQVLRGVGDPHRHGVEDDALLVSWALSSGSTDEPRSRAVVPRPLNRAFCTLSLSPSNWGFISRSAMTNDRALGARPFKAAAKSAAFVAGSNAAEIAALTPDMPIFRAAPADTAMRMRSPRGPPRAAGWPGVVSSAATTGPAAPQRGDELPTGRRPS